MNVREDPDCPPGRVYLINPEQVWFDGETLRERWDREDASPEPDRPEA